MRWDDQAILLSARPYGENGLIVSLLTRQNGRHGGLVQGGQSKRHRAAWQSGNWLEIEWRGRLAEQLGTVSGELRAAYGPRWLSDAARLAAVSAACAVSDLCLPDHVPNPRVFDGLLALFDGLDGESWPTLYVHWELGLLRELGFGLDLTACAVTGATLDLAYVSPKSGRAVSVQGGQGYHDRLLALPSFLLDGSAGDAKALVAGLELTGFFLERHVLAPLGRRLPAARSRLVDRLRA
jgi:DNA repair protein RecO (recombination protein O)